MLSSQSYQQANGSDGRITGVPAVLIPQGVEVTSLPGKGLGVVARRTFEPGEIIETCPMLILPENGPVVPVVETGSFRFDDLEDYYFAWGPDRCAIALGLGGLYNHAAFPNARNIKHLETARMTIQAHRQILPGQEITIHYQQVWFEPLD
jgi:SET domain-containing protein